MTEPGPEICFVSLIIKMDMDYRVTRLFLTLKIRVLVLYSKVPIDSIDLFWDNATTDC